MLNRKITDAYHKITAPDGLRERIEARVQAEQEAAAVKKAGWRFRWMPQAAAFAVAAVCLALLAGGGDIGDLAKTFRSGDVQTESVPGVQLLLDDGEPLGESRRAVEVISGAGEDLNAMLCHGSEEGTGSAMTAERPSDTNKVSDEHMRQAVIFQVRSEDTVTFTADSECLSTYDEEKKRWADGKKELTIDREGELCVVLLPTGDDEVFYIQVSSAECSGWIEIVYNEAAGQYEAACRTTTGE